MSGVEFVFPDTGEAAWWCICAENDCQARAFGPHRTRESAESDADMAGCDHAHFVSPRVGRHMELRDGFAFGRSCVKDFILLSAEITPHNALIFQAVFP